MSDRDTRSANAVVATTCLLLPSLLLACLFAGTAAAAEARYLTEFSAYQAAFKQGRIADSLTHGKAAWRAAEVELGDSAETAVLAYNYARVAFRFENSAADARSAYERVLILSEAGIGSFRSDDLRIALAETNLSLQADQAETVLRLEQLLWERRRAGLAATELSAHAWKSLAMAELQQLERLSAAHHADIAALEAESLQPLDVDLASEAYLLSAIARLSDRHCAGNPDQIRAAIGGLERTIALTSPQLHNNTLASRQATALEWRDSAEQLRARMRGARSQGDAKYWPRQ